MEVHIEPIGERVLRYVARNHDTSVQTFAVDSQSVRLPPTGLAHHIDEELTVYIEAKAFH